MPHPEIEFTVDVPDEPLMGRFDARLMGQALTNLVKNADRGDRGACRRDAMAASRISVTARSDD